MGDVLDVGDLQLLLDGERVEEVAAEHDRVGRGVHRVDPPVDGTTSAINHGQRTVTIQVSAKAFRLTSGA